jgi:vitamin B12 transporter
VEKNASFGTAVVPRLSATFDLHDGAGTWGRLAVKANAGLGVKEPTILQSFSPSPFFRGNPDLEPERARTYDLGLEQRLADDRVKLGVVWFSNRYRNQISTRTTNPATFEAAYFNIGQTQARGVEWSAEFVPAPEWRLGVNYTFLASTIVESTSAFSPVFAEGAWAFRRPRHAGAVEVGWTRGAADVALFGRLVGRRSDSDFASLAPPILEADRYTTWSLTARYRLRVPVDLTLRIDNLTGTSYMEPVGFPAWGRTAHVGVGVRF